MKSDIMGQTPQRRRFGLGDSVPWFSVRSTNNDDFHFATVAGRYIVLCFFGSMEGPSRAAHDFIVTDLRTYLDDQHTTFFGVSVDPEDERQQRVRQQPPGLRYFWDFNRHVSVGYGALAKDDATEYQGFTLLLDPQLRVLAQLMHSDTELHNTHMSRLLHQLRTAPPLMTTHAPVLVLPRVFEPEFCRELIAIYEREGGKESGFMREIGGNTVGILDEKFKRRKDFAFDQQPQFEPLREAIRGRITRRLVPEVKKAFQFTISRMERFTIACYESEVGGFFNAHRDNTTRGTAHRQFACTINLNAEEFEGGELRFPEYGMQTYRAPTGGAVIFSCSLLHEAKPVTAGKRFAFLPFFYDEASAKIRAENHKYIKSSY